MRAPARFFAALGVSLLVASAAVGTVVVTAGRAGSRADGFTRAQADELVRAHNAWRQRAGVLSLRWAADLAARAQARAEYLAAHGCLIEHGLLPEDVGENLYHAGPLHAEGRKDELFAVTPAQVVDTWGAESADYSAAQDTCARNRQCGHYTQIVWTITEEVGCGMSVCPTLGQVWVCNYRPKGNIRVVLHE
jgi:pathogenesis-related protein 1